MRVENHTGRVRRSRLIVWVRRPIGSHLRGMIVALVAIGVRMDLSG